MRKLIYLLPAALTPGHDGYSRAGGVAVSGLEMTQNSMRLQWSREELCQRLRVIMSEIHERCVEYGEDSGYVNYAKGANIAGFVKVDFDSIPVSTSAF